MKKLSKCLVLSLLIGGVNLTLAGCIHTVYIPVTSCPEPPPKAEITLLTDDLTSRSTEDEILKSLTYDFLQLKGSLSQCNTILDGYRKKAK